MTASLSVTKTLTNDYWTISASLVSGSLPSAIFMYENTGTTTLGTYSGVANFEDLARTQIWSGVALPSFGNKYVRHTTAIINVPKGDDPDLVISRLIDSVKILSSTYTANSTSTQVYIIP